MCVCACACALVGVRACVCECVCVTQVERDYANAFQTAHLEVPGDMFAVANRAAARGKGVVGSTSNILDFIVAKTKAALAAAPAAAPAGAAAAEPEKLVFVLGTEAGMVTP